jgi:hypothetical protein
VRALLNRKQLDEQVCHGRSLHRVAETGRVGPPMSPLSGRSDGYSQASVARSQGPIRVS